MHAEIIAEHAVPLCCETSWELLAAGCCCCFPVELISSSIQLQYQFQYIKHIEDNKRYEEQN